MPDLTTLIDWIPGAVQGLGVLAALLVALGVIWTRLVRPTYRGLRNLVQDIATLKAMADSTQQTVTEQLRPNGGSSLWDKVTRIEQQGLDAVKAVDELTERKEAEHAEIRAGHQQLQDAIDWQREAYEALASEICSET